MSTPPLYWEYIMGQESPFVYGGNNPFGSQGLVDEIITGAIPIFFNLSCHKTNRLTDKTQLYQRKIKPLSATRATIDQIFYPPSETWIGPQLERLQGLVTLPAAIIGDIVKPPYYLAQIVVSSSRCKRARKAAENAVINDVMTSLFVSQNAVYEIVLKLGIETDESWSQYVRDNGVYLYLALARLLEAYGSRFAPPGVVYLASRRELYRHNCSGIALLHFDQINTLKENLISVKCLPREDPIDAFDIVVKWLPTLVQALKGTLVDKNDNQSFCHMLQRLYSIQEELHGLLLATPQYKDRKDGS